MSVEMTVGCERERKRWSHCVRGYIASNQQLAGRMEWAVMFDGMGGEIIGLEGWIPAYKGTEHPLLKIGQGVPRSFDLFFLALPP